MGGGWGQRRTGPRVGGYPVGSSGPAPWTPPPSPKFPGASEAGAGWGTQGALCRGGGGRGCASLGAGPAGGMGRLTLKGALFAGAPPAPAGGGASARSGLPSGRAAGSGQTRRRARSWGRTGRRAPRLTPVLPAWRRPRPRVTPFPVLCQPVSAAPRAPASPLGAFPPGLLGAVTSSPYFHPLGPD